MKSLTIQSTADLQALALRCQLRIDQCADMIKMLSGTDPSDLKSTFTVRDVEIVSFEYGSNELDFCLGFFMSWHQYYTRQLTQINQLLRQRMAAA